MAAGAGGAILRSDDHGAVWTPCNSGTRTNLTGITCHDSSFCLAVGAAIKTEDVTQSGAALRSVDGGVTWSGSSTGLSTAVQGVTCPSSSTCLAVGSNGTALRSADGSKSWLRSSTPRAVASSMLLDVTCTSTHICLAGGGGIDANKARVYGTMLRSDDGGPAWQASPPN